MRATDAEREVLLGARALVDELRAERASLAA